MHLYKVLRELAPWEGRDSSGPVAAMSTFCFSANEISISRLPTLFPSLEDHPLLTLRDSLEDREASLSRAYDGLSYIKRFKIVIC